MSDNCNCQKGKVEGQISELAKKRVCHRLIGVKLKEYLLLLVLNFIVEV